MQRPLELVSGLAAGLLGLVGLGYAVAGFHPEEQLDTVLVIFLMVTVLRTLGIPLGAYLHSWREIELGWRLLWASTAALGCCTILGIFSVGLLLLPAVTLAVVAVIASSC